MKTQNQNSVKDETQSCQMAVSGSVMASELRIGNFVNVPRKDQSPFRIDAFECLSKKFIKVAMIHPEYGENFHPLTWYGDDLKPIPLTEEWLLKLGAIEEMLGHFLLDRFQLIWKESYNYWYIIDRYNACYYSKVEFVHEWQNLYFALNGSDLTIGCLTDH